MPLTETDCALLSTIAYSKDVESWNELRGRKLKAYLSSPSTANGLANNPWTNSETGEDTWVTTHEWHAMLNAAANSNTLSGYQVGEVAKNPYDGSEMIYLYNPSTSEACFTFEGASTSEGWFEDGRILDVGDTASQRIAVEWAQKIMDKNDKAGLFYSYSAAGHSKGGSQAAALTRLDRRIAVAYCFDGPGDDVGHGKDDRINYINHEGDPVSALLFLLKNEKLIRGTSPDPKHTTGIFGAHSPSNLFNFTYEDGVLVCTDLGKDVTSEGGAWYRDFVRTLSKTVGLTDPTMRHLFSMEIGAILYIATNDLISTFQKIGGVLSVLLISEPLSKALAAALVAGLAIYGVKKIIELGIFLVGKVFDFVVDVALTLVQAAAWCGEQLQNAINYITSVILPFTTATWKMVSSWVSATIEQTKKFIEDSIGFYENAVTSIRNFFSDGAHIYDFSESRITQLKSLLSSAQSFDLFNPYSWDALYAEMPTMNRLSLGDVQPLIQSAIASEWDVGRDAITKMGSAFKRAHQEDLRFSHELAHTTSSVRAASVVFA